MSRDSIHQRIDELLGLLSIHNSRLSLHTEKLSQLDIDVLRKQCIDLYDEVNKLALQGKIKTGPRKPQAEQTPEPVVAAPIAKEPLAEPTPVPVVPEKPKEAVPTEPVKAKKEEAKPAVEQRKPKPKVEDEMLSLFEKFSSKPIDTISKGMSVAKRFEFQSAFFDGDNVEYKEFITKLDGAGDRESAFEVYHEYKTKLSWDNEELKDELKALMYRKYH